MKLEDLKNKEFEITDEGFLRMVEKKGKYIPSKWERYYFVDTYGGIVADINSGNQGPQWCISHSQVFQTQKEADEYKHYLETLDKYKCEFTDEEWEDENVEKLLLCFHANSNELDFYHSYNLKFQNCIYFKSLEDAEDFIKEAGIENIKKFMFDVWE